jgi:16S rRNA (guanine1207-N2)-methyltransferase
VIEFSDLRRWPDAEAPNLFASDAADRLIIDTAFSSMTGPSVSGAAGGDSVQTSDSHRAPGSIDSLAGNDVVVIGDGYGALTLAAASVMRDRGASRAVRVHQDSIVSERALAANADRLGMGGAFRSCELDAQLVRDVRLVLLRLPMSLDALDEIAAIVASSADRAVTVIAGGMQKHMTTAMNAVFARYFERVDVGHGRQKARVLSVRDPKREHARAALAALPRRQRHGDIAPGLVVCARGGVFAGTRIDIGTRFLLRHLDDALQRPDGVLPSPPGSAGAVPRPLAGARGPVIGTVVDLACGTGVLASVLALRRPELRVIATDQSAAAAASARATVEANGVAARVEVRREDAGEGIPDGSADLVLLNPPFHNGAALDLRIGRMLVGAAARILAPGGQLLTVFNSHLDYRPLMQRIVGPTRQVDRNAKFTIVAATRLPRAR